MITMKRVLTGAMLTAGLAAPLALAACTPVPKPVSCGYVGFAPNTDWGAFNIYATNASCVEARRLAGITIFAADRGFTYLGYTCPTPTKITYGLAGSHYRCTASGGRVVTWDNH